MTIIVVLRVNEGRQWRTFDAANGRRTMGSCRRRLVGNQMRRN